MPYETGVSNLLPSYSMRYIFPPKQMTPEEIAEEEKRQRQAELNRIKQMADNKKKEERELRLYGTRIEEPSLFCVSPSHHQTKKY
jgi:hypothetical protein